MVRTLAALKPASQRGFVSVSHLGLWIEKDSHTLYKPHLSNLHLPFPIPYDPDGTANSASLSREDTGPEKLYSTGEELTIGCLTADAVESVAILAPARKLERRASFGKVEAC